ncbi:MAG: nuclear transport factor 2 family protein [Thermoplasmatota archaeon]
MATVGHGALAEAAHLFFDNLRQYDAEAAAAVLAEDAEFTSPWNDGTLVGREAIQESLAALVGDAKTRPSFSIIDVDGDGTLVKFTLSVSQRFGHLPQKVRMDLLCHKGQVHQVVVRAA